MVDVAQLVRALACDARGCEFEPRRLPQKKGKSMTAPTKVAAIDTIKKTPITHNHGRHNINWLCQVAIAHSMKEALITTVRGLEPLHPPNQRKEKV